MQVAIVKARIPLLCLVFVSITGCDPERKKKCEWYLVPEPEHIERVDEGMIPVCARNYTNNKQYCRLQATLDFTRDQYEKRFRFVDMEIDKSGTFPRRVVSIKYCD